MLRESVTANILLKANSMYCSASYKRYREIFCLSDECNIMTTEHCITRYLFSYRLFMQCSS